MHVFLCIPIGIYRQYYDHPFYRIFDLISTLIVPKRADLKCADCTFIKKFNLNIWYQNLRIKILDLIKQFLVSIYIYFIDIIKWVNYRFLELENNKPIEKMDKRYWKSLHKFENWTLIGVSKIFSDY